jgi:hypothetical protein
MGLTLFSSINVTRLAYLTAGWLALGLGILGFVLPLMPCVPFLIIAAWCFSRGSDRVHDWLLRHRRFGPLIRNWNDYQVIPLPAKIGAVIGLASSVTFLICLLPYQPALADEVWLTPVVEAAWPIPTVVGMFNAVIGTFILSRPSRRPPVTE